MHNPRIVDDRQLLIQSPGINEENNRISREELQSVIGKLKRHQYIVYFDFGRQWCMLPGFALVFLGLGSYVYSAIKAADHIDKTAIAEYFGGGVLFAFGLILLKWARDSSRSRSLCFFNRIPKTVDVLSKIDHELYRQVLDIHQRSHPEVDIQQFKTLTIISILAELESYLRTGDEQVTLLTVSGP